MVKSVLISGCSEGSLGDALAQEFHRRGLLVIATARDPAKMAHLSKMGIATVQLDVLSEPSISAAVGQVRTLTKGSLDILINNAGGLYCMPVTDASFAEAKAMFDLNFWSYISVTRAFIPLLQRADKAVIVNQTSVASLVPTPFFGLYNASKAATAAMTDTLRIELAPFGVRVVELKTGAVKSGVFRNQNVGQTPKLPRGSIFEPARDVVEESMLGAHLTSQAQDAHEWAKAVADGVLKSSPAPQLWKGASALVGWFALFVPTSMMTRILWPMCGMDKVQTAIKAAQ